VTEKLKLTIELVPASSWYNNLRSLLKKEMWDNLRKTVYAKCNYKCAICNSKGKLHCHEIWKYNDKKHIQKLVDLVALCTKCHWIKHIGLAGIHTSQERLSFEKLVKHFMKVNDCDRTTFEKHKSEAFKKWEERSRYEWTMDLSVYKNIEKHRTLGNGD